MKWKKLGLIFEPPTTLNWANSHAALPYAYKLQGNLYRIYFSSRDKKNRSKVGFFEMDISKPGQVENISSEPVVDIGPLGSFDDSGVTNSCVVSRKSRLFLYYSGWSLGVTVPFYFYIGAAVSNDGGKTFSKVSESPVLARDKIDPYLTASPYILIEDGVWKMWYVSGVKWEENDPRPKHYYHIKYAESHDGLNWKKRTNPALDFKSEDEYAISRPTVLSEDGLYKMWYPYRGKSYRIGYAESQDGVNWNRKDKQAGIDVSDNGWDSEMIEYPHVFDHNGERYMLYNGNGYGKTGIGLAKRIA